MSQEIYGYVNGNPVYSRDEYIFKSRGFEEITSDNDLLKYAEKVTSGWQSSGHKQFFTHFYLSDYALNEPYASLTIDEFTRLKQLQEIAYKDWEDEQKQFKYENFEGKELTESEIRLFLDKRIQETTQLYGDSHFLVEQSIDRKNKIISKFRQGEIVPVDSTEYNAEYGNGTGAYAKTLYSDGSIRETCFGYLD